MYRSQALRIARASARPAVRPVARRGYAATTPPPPAGQPAPNPTVKKSDNTLLYAALAVAAAGGGYYWYTQEPEQVDHLKAKAKAEEEKLKGMALSTYDSAKAKTDSAFKKGESKADDLKATLTHAAEGKDKWASAKTQAEKEARGRSLPEDLEAKYDAAKNATQEGLNKARDSTESLYRDARSATEQKYGEARSAAERKANEARHAAEAKKEEAKAGWFSWLGWGKSKAEVGKENTEAEAEHLKREGAQKVANASDNVKQRAEKHT